MVEKSACLYYLLDNSMQFVPLQNRSSQLLSGRLNDNCLRNSLRAADARGSTYVLTKVKLIFTPYDLRRVAQVIVAVDGCCGFVQAAHCMHGLPLVIALFCELARWRVSMQMANLCCEKTAQCRNVSLKIPRGQPQQPWQRRKQDQLIIISDHTWPTMHACSVSCHLFSSRVKKSRMTIDRIN
jgi:hypothetical protein